MSDARTRQGFIEWVREVRQQGEVLLNDDLKAGPRVYFTQGASLGAVDFYSRAEKWRRWRLGLISGLRARVMHCDHLCEDAAKRFDDRNLFTFTIVAINQQFGEKTFDLTQRATYEHGHGWQLLHEWFPRGPENPMWDAVRSTMLKEIQSFTTMLLEQASDLPLVHNTRPGAEIPDESTRAEDSVEGDAEAVLLALARYEKSPGDENRGRYAIPGPELAKLTGIGPARVQDAVDVLERSGYVKARRVMGAAPYGFASVELTAAGRMESQRIQRVQASPMRLVAAAPGSGEDAIVVGQWRVLKPLSRDGQGEVLLVERVDGDRVRGVLKRVPRDIVADAKRLTRFRHEIRIVRDLRHPFVAEVLDTNLDGEMWFVTRYAAYGSLAENVAWFRGDAWRTLRMARDIATALGAAHAQRVIHRDVKPGNVLVYDPNHFALTDFGIAHHPDHTAITGTHERVGPRWFVPPEGEDGRTDPQPSHDVYMLGKLIYFALTGGGTFIRERFADEGANIEAKFRRPEFAAINDLFSKMIVEDPGKRFQSMDDVVVALDATSTALVGGRTASVSTQSEIDPLDEVLSTASESVSLDEALAMATGGDGLVSALKGTPYATNIFVQPIKESAVDAPFHLKAVEETHITLVKESNEDHFNVPLACIESFIPRTPFRDDRLLTLRRGARVTFDGAAWRFQVDG